MGNGSSTPEKSVSPPISEPATTNVTPPVPPPSAVAPASPPNEIKPIKPVEEPSTNPGTYEELHKACKEMFPQPFEGGRFVLGKALGGHFQVTHTITLGSPMVSGYRFGATFIGDKQLSPQESYPVFLGDIDASGNLNANIMHSFSKQVFSRFTAQFQGDKSSTQLVTDYKGSSYTASLAVANPDLLNGTGLAVGHFLQRVTPSIDVGAECMYQKGGQIPGGQVAMMSLAAKIRGEKWQLATTLCPGGAGGGGLHASYVHKINNEMQIGAEFETNFAMGESTTSVGYQIEVPSAGANFKGQIDSNWTLAATLEKKLPETPFPLTFTLSALGNHVKSDFKFGIGMNVG